MASTRSRRPGGQSDSIFDDDGDDVIYSGAGSDKINGGANSTLTTADYSDLSKGDTISYTGDKAGIAFLSEDDTYTVVEGGGANTKDSLTGVERIVGTDKADTFGVAGDINVIAGDGDDFVTVNLVNPTNWAVIDGGKGSDSIVFAGADGATHGHDAATIVISPGADYIDGRTFADDGGFDLLAYHKSGGAIALASYAVKQDDGSGSSVNITYTGLDAIHAETVSPDLVTLHVIRGEEISHMHWEPTTGEYGTSGTTGDDGRTERPDIFNSGRRRLIWELSHTITASTREGLCTGRYQLLSHRRIPKVLGAVGSIALAMR